MNLPDFLIIGAQKSGTTWLWNEMRQHPDIFMPDRKELHYFSNDGQIKFNDANSMDWYQSHFKCSKQAMRIGEATPSYLNRPCSAENIYKTIPNVKLIVILRQPANRAYSQWRMLRKKMVVPLNYSFLESFYCDLPKQVGMKKRGFYAQQLKIYYKVFNKDKILILFYDDLIKDYKGFLKQVYSFLNITSDFLSATAHEFLKPFHHFEDIVPKKIPLKDKQEVTSYYRQSIGELELLLNMNLSHWKLL